MQLNFMMKKDLGFPIDKIFVIRILLKRVMLLKEHYLQIIILLLPLFRAGHPEAIVPNQATLILRVGTKMMKDICSI